MGAVAVSFPCIMKYLYNTYISNLLKAMKFMKVKTVSLNVCMNFQASRLIPVTDDKNDMQVCKLTPVSNHPMAVP